MAKAERPPVNFVDSDPDQLLKIGDLDALGLMAPGTARNRISAGTFPFPYVRLGSNVRFRLGDVREYIASQLINT